jgi:quercetin dioxygenase-like cupin family protein
VRLGICIEPELEEDLLHVGLDGALGHEEPPGDRLVRKALRDQAQHLPGSNRKELQMVTVDKPAEHDTRAIGWQPGGGETIRNPVGGPLTFKVRAEQTNGALTVVESTAPPGEGPLLHVHANEDEALYTLDGTLRFRMEDEVQTAPAGAFAFIPRGHRTRGRT